MSEGKSAVPAKKELPKSSGIEVYKGDPYAVMQYDKDAIAEVFDANVSGSVDQFDFDRVSMPGSGGVAWTVPDLNGEPEPVKELVGVVILHGDRRAYWETPYEESGGGSPPDCNSLNGKLGLGFIRGDDREGEPIERTCKNCRMSQWGSFNDDGEDNRQACSNRKLVALIRPEDTIPLVVDLAPTSVKPFSRFLLRLAGRGVPCYGAVIGLGLMQEDSRTGVEYSVVKPRLIAAVPSDQIASFKAVADVFRPIFTEIAIEEQGAE